MTWSPFDCHAHTTWSDGQLDLDSALTVARARGVRPSIADHASTDVAGAIATMERLVGYLDALERHDCGRSAEFCWHDVLWRSLTPAIDARFTHTVGSLHAVWLPDGTLQRVFTRALADGLTPRVYVDALLDNLARLATEMPVDVIAHPTLLPIPLRSIPPEELWREQDEERMVQLFVASGLAFEVSSRYRPHERLVRRAAQAGVRLSLGSDGHSAEQVGDVAFSLALTRTLGVPDHALYDPAVHGRRRP
jgi:histidinol phosphatase-like PHP family hydrolase